MKSILTLTSLLLLFIACKKDPEVKFHELKEGKHVTISWYHYNGLVDTRDANNNYYTNIMSKVLKTHELYQKTAWLVSFMTLIIMTPQIENGYPRMVRLL